MILLYKIKGRAKLNGQEAYISIMFLRGYLVVSRKLKPVILSAKLRKIKIIWATDERHLATTHCNSINLRG